MALFRRVLIYAYIGYELFQRIYRDKMKIVQNRQKNVMKNMIGQNIKRLRRQQEIKQAVLASELSIGRQTLSAYERGVTLPDVFALIKIADYFDVSLDELTGRQMLIIPDEKE